jgi:hypothetical protein
VIVLLLTSQNEAEMLAWNLRHHLEYGIDHVAVADNASTDDTQDVIASFGDAVTSVVFDDFHTRQAVRMQLLDAIKARHAVDWVGVSDTDEFWFATELRMPDLLAGTPDDVVAVNFDAKLFVPTALDSTDGPVMARRRYRTTNQGPLHTSYVAGKSLYRAAWLQAIGDEHLDRSVPHERYRHDVAAVHHYMVRDEDQFVQKVTRLISWAPNEGRGLGARLRRRGVDPRSRELPSWSAPFKKEWWRVYQDGGEDAVRRYYRERYTLSADDVARHKTSGDLVFDDAFADYITDRIPRDHHN